MCPEQNEIYPKCSFGADLAIDTPLCHACLTITRQTFMILEKFVLFSYRQQKKFEEVKEISVKKERGTQVSQIDGYKKKVEHNLTYHLCPIH